MARIPASQVGLQGAVYIVIRARNVEDCYREEEMPDGTWVSEVIAVSPGSLCKKARLDAMGYAGADEWPGAGEAILDTMLYGHCFEAASFGPGQKESVIEDARDEAEAVGLMFGFYADRRVNMLGETGWDRLKGTDLRKILKRKGV